ncbi:MaoC family dehydratase [Desulfotruncus alcoholivorax]|uniref:MaoC family dehydratase n=1 Tax=Desulfotruncus alcoholivorax TaxID=265477 RepID=UPI00041309B8|nr:MaoC family dehydratase [Desulfotruncus alcoholivorax]
MSENKSPLKYINIGEIETFTKTISEYDVYGFAGIVGDFYGVHLDEEFAKKTQYGTRIAQGALSVGLISTVMGYMAKRFPLPGAVSYRYDIKFVKPVFIGDTITAKLELAEKEEDKRRCIFKASCVNQRGEVVAEGKTYMKVLLTEAI